MVLCLWTGLDQLRQVGKKHKRVSLGTSKSSSGGQSSPPLLKGPRPKRSKVKVPIVEEGETFDDSDHDADWQPCSVQRSPSRFIGSLSTSRSSPDVVKAADKIRKKYRGASSSQPTKQYRYTKDVMKAEASDCGVYEDGWPADIYWFRRFVRGCAVERGKRYNFASQTVVHVQRCLWWICRSGPRASQAPPQFDIQMLTRDALTAYRDYLNSVGLEHSTVSIWFQTSRVYLD